MSESHAFEAEPLPIFSHDLEREYFFIMVLGIIIHLTVCVSVKHICSL